MIFFFIRELFLRTNFLCQSNMYVCIFSIYICRETSISASCSMSTYFASIDTGVKGVVACNSWEILCSCPHGTTCSCCQGSDIKRYNGTVYSITVERKLRKANISWQYVLFLFKILRTNSLNEVKPNFLLKRIMGTTLCISHKASFFHALFMFKKLAFIVFWLWKLYLILLFYEGVFVNHLKKKSHNVILLM